MNRMDVTDVMYLVTDVLYKTEEEENSAPKSYYNNFMSFLGFNQNSVVTNKLSKIKEGLTKIKNELDELDECKKMYEEKHM